MILFIDYSCYKPYDPYILSTQPLGGSEATAVRIAESLGETQDVIVVQHNRLQKTQFNALYTTIEDIPNISNPTHVITVRSQKMFPFIFKCWPNAKHYIWSQDLPFDRFVAEYNLIKDLPFEYISVSNWHKNEIINKTGCNKVNVLYNPIDNDNLENKDYNKNKLVFFSSPHKGLNETIEIFEELVKKHPNLTLYYSNPGYFPNLESNHPNIINIGQKSNAEILDFIKDALCIFYPNYIYPETFGIVFAESNALGIPVLTHNLGAASEVLDNPQSQLIDCTNTQEIEDTINNWRSGDRPIVKSKDEFKKSNVIKEWKKLLNVKDEKKEIVKSVWDDAITL